MKFFAAILKGLGLFIALIFVSHGLLSQSLDPIADENIDEDAGLQTITLTGISSTTSFEFSSSNSLLLPIVNISVNYTNPNTTGTLEYTIVDDGFGTTTLTVTPKNGLISGTPQSFVITVNSVNDPPDFDISAGNDVITLDEDAGQQSIINWAENIIAGGSGNFIESDELFFDLTITNTTSNISFDNLSITPQGVLKFQTSQDTNGQATIDVILKEAPPNTLESGIKTFIISVNPINDRPIFTPGDDVVVNEDDGPIEITGWATDISPGGGDDELAQNLAFDVDIVGIIDNLTFVSDPTIDVTTGNLTFETSPDDFGTATIKVTLIDDGSDIPPNDNMSITQSFTIDVLPINDAPDFVMPDTLVVNEDDGEIIVTQFISEITKGPDNELDQSIDFSLSIEEQSNFLTFKSNPKITEDGTLSFETNPDANGIAKIRVTCIDSGPSEPPPNENTAVNDLVLIVNSVNDAPTFDISDDIVIDEDVLGSFENWASNISPGPEDEQNQIITFQITSRGTTGSLEFDIGPLINESGTLEFQMAEHTNGQSTFEIIAIDDGPQDELNKNTSTRKGFSITVLPVNDAPVFNPGEDPQSLENIGFIEITDWATGITPGGGVDEEGQIVEFEIEPIEFEGSLGFALGPVIEPDGTLSYQSTTNTFGRAMFTVTLVDDGPDEAPNVNISETVMLTITVSEVNDPPNDIFLSNNKVEELREPGTFIGDLTAIDPDDETHTFELVPGEGSNDNDNFTIEGNQLLSAIEFSVDEQSIHAIRISAFDGENTFEKIFAIEIIRQPVDGVTFANAFTPNGDGANDVWVIEQIEFFPTADVSIFNREGQRVFNSTGYRTPWDGKYQGNDLPPDSYYYVIDLKNNTDILRGTVTIVR